ncbi:unnamed protein product [Pieris macdunnoughi]|uniref:Uncharacterized protein n=1 Tax=Pieris macdunnoughi TaxID=345717 RepID=A0A821MEK2_9NEOP|nr:unnamed protein product [Pieris macdunnoughi]
MGKTRPWRYRQFFSIRFLSSSSHRHRGKQSRLHIAIPSSPSVDFCIIRELNSNLNAVHHHLGSVGGSDLPRDGVCVYVREKHRSRHLAMLEDLPTL